MPLRSRLRKFFSSSSSSIPTPSSSDTSQILPVALITHLNSIKTPLQRLSALSGMISDFHSHLRSARELDFVTFRDTHHVTYVPNLLRELEVLDVELQQIIEHVTTVGLIHAELIVQGVFAFLDDGEEEEDEEIGEDEELQEGWVWTRRRVDGLLAVLQTEADDAAHMMRTAWTRYREYLKALHRAG